MPQSKRRFSDLFHELPAGHPWRWDRLGISECRRHYRGLARERGYLFILRTWQLVINTGNTIVDVHGGL